MTLAPLHTEDQLAELLRATSHPGKAARETLLKGQQRLDDAFADTPIRELVAARAALVDGVLIAAWRFFSLDRDSNSALVAVGQEFAVQSHLLARAFLLCAAQRRDDATTPYQWLR